MSDILLKTCADDLYELVKSRKKISVEDAAKMLKMSNDTVQALVDFLVEEKIFGIEYKFTTPYVYLSHEKSSVLEQPKKKVMTKEEFFKKAGTWNISAEKISGLWKKYVQENIGYIKEDFYAKANSRNLPEETIEQLWKKYLNVIS